MKEKLIHINLRDPRRSPFAKKSDPAEAFYYYCNAATCEALDNGKCLNLAPGVKCPHGSVSRQRGPGRRANAFAGFLKRHGAAKENLKLAVSPGNKNDGLIGCGDFIYLPYSHLNLSAKDDETILRKEGSLFGQHSDYFIKKEHFNKNFVMSMLDHRPVSAFFSEITTYQSDEIPNLIRHCKNRFPSIMAEIAQVRPSIKELSERLAEKESSPVKARALSDRRTYAVEWNGKQGKLSVHLGFITPFSFKYESYIDDRAAKIKISMNPDDEVILLNKSDFKFVRD